MSAESQPKLPGHWFIDQTGSNQTSFTDHPPLPSTCIDVGATIARNKPTYAVQNEAARPSQKILIITDYTLLVPLIRFSARTRNTLKMLWIALQGPRPFRVFIPTVSSDASHGCFRLIEVSTWDGLVNWLALMVPLSRQELGPLITDAKLPMDLVLIIDHTGSVPNALTHRFDSQFSSPSTEKSATLPEMNLAHAVNGRFVFNKVEYRGRSCPSVLADWCKRSPAIPCIIDARELPDFSHKKSLIATIDSKSSPFDLKSCVNTSIEHLEIRSQGHDESLFFRAQDQRHSPFFPDSPLHTVIVPWALLPLNDDPSQRMKPAMCRLKPSSCLRFSEIFDLSLIESVLFLPDEHFNYDGVDVLLPLSLLQRVISIALPSTCMRCPAQLFAGCPRAAHISITVALNSSISQTSWADLGWVNLPHVCSLELKITSIDRVDSELVTQIPLLLRAMGHVKTLILSSDFPSAFTFPIDDDARPAREAITDLILNFPCTENHHKFFVFAFRNAKVIRLLETAEPVCYKLNELPEVAGGKVARMTVTKVSYSAMVSESVNFGDCATIEVHCVGEVPGADAFFLQQFNDSQLREVRTVVFINNTSFHHDVRRRMIGSCVHNVPRTVTKSEAPAAQRASNGVAGDQSMFDSGCRQVEGGGARAMSATADDWTECEMRSLCARVLFKGHNPSVYRLHVHDTVEWDGGLRFVECKHQFAICDMSTLPKKIDIECEVPLKYGLNLVPQLWVGSTLSIPCPTLPATAALKSNRACMYQLPCYHAEAQWRLRFAFVEHPSTSIVALPLPADIKRALDCVGVLTRLGIESSDSPSVQVHKICCYCRDFHESPLVSECVIEHDYSSSLKKVEESHRPAYMLFLRLFFSQAGVCRHRSQVATVLCHYVGVPAMYVTNDLHAFIEVVLDGRLQSFDLGGGNVDSISYLGPDGTLLTHQPEFSRDNERFGNGNVIPSPEIPSVSTAVHTISAFAAVSASLSVLPGNHCAELVERILKVTLVDRKSSVEEVTESLQMGSSFLVETRNCSRDSKLLLNCVAAQHPIWKVVHVKSLYDFQHAWDAIEFIDGNFKSVSFNSSMCLVIDYLNIIQSHLVDLQASIDAALTLRKDTTCVIGMINQAFADTRSEDFFSRWHKRMLLEFNASNYDVHAIPMSNPHPSSRCTVLDLHCSTRWESVLFGRVRRNGDLWTLESGRFQLTLAEHEQSHGSQPLHLCIRNPPTHIAAFMTAWETLLRNRCLTWYGSQCPIPQQFSWSFETTDAVLQLLQFEQPRSVAWFISSDTIAFLQPFPYINPDDGCFAQHSGYLQQMLSSQANVVLDSKLSRNELAHVIDSDLHAFPRERLFISGSSAVSLALRVEGRAIHFSLSERVAESLIRQLDGLRFEETEWLKALEEETNTFTIVLPAEHPDMSHVLNWIKYRQIWFPHRAVHIEAQLHVMHTERLGSRSSANLSAVSRDAFDQLDQCLRRERLLQLSGPPGCGKTTLASRFHRDETAKREGGLVAETFRDDVCSADGSDRPPALNFSMLSMADDVLSSSSSGCESPPFSQGSSRQHLKRFSITTQINQLLSFLEVECDAVLVVEEFNLQDDGWWDNLLDIKSADRRFFHKGKLYESQFCKTVLLIGNSAMQGGRVSTAIETHCFLAECKAMSMEELVHKAIPSAMRTGSNCDELHRWAVALRGNALFARSGYDLTLRDLEAVVFEALHAGVSIEEAGQRVLGYYCGDMLPVQQGIEERVRSFLKPAEGAAAAYLECKPLTQRRKHGLFFVGESGVGKTTMCLKVIEELQRPFFAMSQSDDALWAVVDKFLQNIPDQTQKMQLGREMSHFGEHQRREKAVLVAAKCGVILFIDELNTDRNLRLEETLNQVSTRRLYLDEFHSRRLRRFCRRDLAAMCIMTFS